MNSSEITRILLLFKQKKLLQNFKIITYKEFVTVSLSSLPFVLVENTGHGYGRGHWFIHIIWSCNGHLRSESFDSLGVCHFPNTNLIITDHRNVNGCLLQKRASSTCGPWCMFYAFVRLKNLSKK